MVWEKRCGGELGGLNMQGDFQELIQQSWRRQGKKIM